MYTNNSRSLPPSLSHSLSFFLSLSYNYSSYFIDNLVIDNYYFLY